MFKWLSKKLTNDYKEVPLFLATFDLQHYKESGKEDSCTVKYHPCLNNDEHVKETLKGLVDYIRNTYDMDKLSK